MVIFFNNNIPYTGSASLSVRLNRGYRNVKEAPQAMVEGTNVISYVTKVKEEIPIML